MQQPVFITGNQHKADYLARQLGIQLNHQKVELDELQSTDLHVIVEHKLRQAYDIVQAAVLVEDVSLEYTALKGLPGPYIKWFINNAGLEASCRILDGFEDRSAIVKTTFGYFDGDVMHFFDSQCPGTISTEPRGENGFGFDAIFIGDGTHVTRAEMSPEENERTYAEYIKPFTAVKEFLNQNGIQ